MSRGKFDIGALWRLTAWGVLASAAVMTAALAFLVNPDGRGRLLVALQGTAGDGDITASIPVAEYGIDLGGAASLDGLRLLWSHARTIPDNGLMALRPVVGVRETPPGPAELRLIAGPVPSFAAAERLCQPLTAAGRLCFPTVFDGQRLNAR